MTRNEGGGWNSPSVILTIISLCMAALGSYLAIQRGSDDDLRQMDRRLTRVETIVESNNRRLDREEQRH